MLAVGQKQELHRKGPIAELLQCMLLRVLAQEEICIVWQSPIAFGSDLYTKTIFSWSRPSRWALVSQRPGLQ